MLAQDNKSAQAQGTILSTLFDATGDLDTAQTLEKSLPAYLLKASATSLARLDEINRELHARQLEVDKDRTRLKPLHDFCISELNAALSKQWPALYDVEVDVVSLPGVDCGCDATPTDEAGIDLVKHASQTLLEAAMQNFTEDEEQADAFPEGSLVSVKSAPQGVSGLTPAAFAAFCRQLDLGKKYQEHLQQVFGLRDESGKVVATSAMTRNITVLKQSLLELDAHLAALKGDITAAGLRMLQDLMMADGVAPAHSLRYDKIPLIMQGIKILDSCVWGVVVFSKRSVEKHPEDGCMVYMPGEPARAVYEYPSFNAFKRYLAQQLKTPVYQDYFARSLDEDDKADFFKTFAEKDDLGVVRQWPISVPLFDFMVQSHVGKLQIDARKLAVPTADIDEETRRKRLLDFVQRGVSIASVAGLFVPVLGQLMMGVAVGQLLGEVYEGVEDWQRDDHQQALSHLLSVVENIALMGVFAGGQKVLGTLGSKLLRAHPEFFGQFSAVLNRAGKPRLWKNDLTRYEHILPGGFTIDASSKELYRIGNKTIARVDNRLLAGRFDPDARRLHLDHPERAQAYAPELSRHVEGGWRLPAEEPEEWGSSAYALKRIDPHLHEFVDSDLDMMRRLSDTSQQALLDTFNDNLKLPVRLRETVERVRIGRQLRELTSELLKGKTHSGQATEEQMHALPGLPGWPTDRYIEVTGEDGVVEATYPTTRTLDETLSLVVTREQLARGRLLQTVIDGLDSQEVDALLGGKPAQGTQEAALAKKVGAALQSDYRAAFERMYQRYDQSEAQELLKLRQVFADIPARLGQRLIDRAPSVERLHLRTTGRVPLRLGQRVRASAAQVRLDRALTGLHWPWLANADTDKLAIDLLPRLSGWDKQLRLEVRDKAVTGPLLQAIGDTSATAENTGYLVKSTHGYEAFGGDKKSLGKVESQPGALYCAILKAIPSRQRTMAGFADAGPASAQRLRTKLLDAALDDRPAAARTLLGGTPEPLVVEPACVQGDQAPATNHPRRLLRTVRKLYPRLDDAQASQLLDELGNDPLSRATRLKALRQDLKILRDVLFIWSEDDVALKAMGGDPAEARQSRKMVAERIEESFRRFHWIKDEQGKSVCTLNLNGMRIGKLPTFSSDLSFAHVQHLSMRKMAQGDDVVYFLKSFKQLESLELDENVITRLPEVLSHMPRLKFLSLEGNQLKLTEHTLAKLNSLRTLWYLNLNHNPLGATPDVSRMSNLRQLLLRDTGITELPEGLNNCAHIEWMDMRKNKIKELPRWLFQKPRRFTQALDLGLNPFTETSKTYLANYRNNVGIGMGYLEEDIPRLNEQTARSLWLTKNTGEEWATQTRIWEAFRDDKRAEGLFHLLAQLGDTVDATKVRADVQRRVWVVLKAAEADGELCDQLLDLAANEVNCDDTAAVNFSHLEVAVHVDRVTRGAGGNVTAKPLLNLGRGLFRLDQLNTIAHEHAKVAKSDPLEVNLAYRIGLAQELDLPGQPQNMLFEPQSGVTAADLDTAKLRINTAELSPQWLKFMQQQTFWRDYLKRTFARKFSLIDQSFAPRMSALEEKADTLASADYVSQWDALKLEKEQAQDALFERLTDESIRLMDLGLCAMPQV
ncbi:MAG TPA: NEL-type E3 ubiquitin ligase domain-containing protein [Pseudomonas sp.]|uniref:NEL-type E3 ubiquitin ligase domain-containing protein n=1 Tax=Pseudomonas sp. TaxID=306 RepID=UPI002D1B0642|nr:NEL-type E3 ubiquitin ligase domain-containing protein [Pseudomonas sp.]HWH88925.1 NEL-type E3 ubiquitin ligase domain-containing protein [Pseudomonas sp.]